MSAAKAMYPSSASSLARFFTYGPSPVHSWTTITPGRFPLIASSYAKYPSKTVSPSLYSTVSVWSLAWTFVAMKRIKIIETKYFITTSLLRGLKLFINIALTDFIIIFVHILSIYFYTETAVSKNILSFLPEQESRKNAGFRVKPGMTDWGDSMSPKRTPEFRVLSFPHSLFNRFRLHREFAEPNSCGIKNCIRHCRCS